MRSVTVLLAVVMTIYATTIIIVCGHSFTGSDWLIICMIFVMVVLRVVSDLLTMLSNKGSITVGQILQDGIC